MSDQHPLTMSAERETLARKQVRHHPGGEVLLAELEATREALSAAESRMELMRLENHQNYREYSAATRQIAVELAEALEPFAAGNFGGSWNKAHAVLAKARAAGILSADTVPDALRPAKGEGSRDAA